MDGSRKKTYCGHPDPERKIYYVLTQKWLLDMNQRTLRETYMSLHRKVKETRSPE